MTVPRGQGICSAPMARYLF